MRVVFMGTPYFAVPSLSALAKHHEVLAAYTRPDAASGRGRVMRPSAVKEAATAMGLDVRTPRTLRDHAEQDVLRRLAPDVGVVVAYGLILPSEVLDVPRLGFVNVHASLLPRWRGAAPIQRAVLAGDPVTGVSIMRMEEGLDTGPVCVQAPTPVDDKNADSLTEELARLGADALIEVLDRMARDTCEWTEQDDDLATYAAKVTKEDVRVGPDLSAQELLRRVRASGSQAPARIVVGGVTLTVLDAAPAAEDVGKGTARRSRTSIVLGTAEGAVWLVRVKPDGRNEMDASAWLRGSTIQDHASWESAR